MLVRPEDTGPASSLMAPIGSPPDKSSSNSGIPVDATSLIVRSPGVSTDGKRWSRECSICSRSATEEGMGIYQIRLLFAFRFVLLARCCQHLFGYETRLLPLIPIERAK